MCVGGGGDAPHAPLAHLLARADVGRLGTQQNGGGHAGRRRVGEIRFFLKEQGDGRGVGVCGEVGLKGGGGGGAATTEAKGGGPLAASQQRRRWEKKHPPLRCCWWGEGRKGFLLWVSMIGVRMGSFGFGW